jgi:toxin ParE1/3/4
MREVVWAVSAVDDLDAILAWIAKDNIKAANDVLNRIEETGEKLGFMATGRQGRVFGTYEKIVRGLPCIIAYEIQRIDEATERIVILHVIHMARDWPEGH